MSESTTRSSRIVIIGGVAAGATAATKARRENETAEIIVLERGPYVSFANCGLPFHVSGEVEHRAALLLQSPETLLERYNLDIRPGHEVLSINRNAHTVRIRLGAHARGAVSPASRRDCPEPGMAAGTEFDLHWDRLILAMGGRPVEAGLPGTSTGNCFTLWTMEDMDRIDTFIKTAKPRHAVVVGASFIGLEAVEALVRRGLKVKLIEQSPCAMPILDPEFSLQVQESLLASGIEILTDTKVTSIGNQHHGMTIQSMRSTGNEPTETQSRDLHAELIILATGVRPNTALALDCGLEIGHTGGLVVNRHLQTSHDSDIYVAGDLAEVPFRSDRLAVRMPLAGPANRQGRIAGANAARSLLDPPGQPDTYPGITGTWVLRVLDHTVAMTGLSEKSALAAAYPAKAVIIHRTDHDAYFQDARPLCLKVVYHADTGMILGAQAFGENGVDKRIDVLATAVQAGMTVKQLAELDLSYAPPFNSANDPINYAGMVASNNLTGFARSVSPTEFLRIFDIHQDLVLDVRMPSENANGAIPGALNIPVDELRARLSEIPRDRHAIFVHCAVGFRAHVAARILAMNGFHDVVNISGGWASLRHFFPLPELRAHH